MPTTRDFRQQQQQQQQQPSSSATQVKQIITQHAASVAQNQVVAPQQQQQQQLPLATIQQGAMLSQQQQQQQPTISVPMSVPMATAPAPPGAVQHAHIQPAAMAQVPVAAAPIVTAQPLMQQSLAAATAAAKRRRLDANAAAQAPSVLNDPSAMAAALHGRGRKKSQAQIDRRRERNRILARRTRLRKKFFFESLQKEVMDLQRENAALKGIVREKLNGEEGTRILNACDAAEKMPPAVVEACGDQAKEMAQQDFNLVRSIQHSQHSFVITDPSLQDNPIVFASDDFLNVTGYARDDVLGRNCRFLQGTDTSAAKVKQIRDGLATGADVTVTLINYMADGTPFWNKLFIAALRDAQNNIVNFIGVIVKVASPEPTDPEHGKLLPGQEAPADDDDDIDFGDDNFGGDASLDGTGAAAAPDGMGQGIPGSVGP